MTKYSINRKDFRGAFKLHSVFREAIPKKARVVTLKLPKAAAVIGVVEFIGYRTTHKGVAHLYKHDFAPGSRPTLASGSKRNQLVLVGGRYHVTDRGIVDLDAQGEEIDEESHGRDLPEGEN